MPDDPADFDDEGPAEGFGALLPADDRIWRHPSELGTAAEPAPPATRRTFLPGPGRPGSWTAGIAGALLATGIVLVATHLSLSSGRASSASGPNGLIARTVTTTAEIAEVPGLQATVVGSQLASAATRVYRATVLVSSTRGSTTLNGAGLVVGANCLVIAPARLVRPGDSVALTLPDGRLVAAQVLGDDPSTGVAVLRCPVTGLATVPPLVERPAAQELVVLVFSAPHAVGMSIGLVTAVEQRVATTAGTLLDELDTDIPPSADGSALIDGDGEVLGMVVGSAGDGSVATPTWLAMAVARRIAASRPAGGAWLGIAGTTMLQAGRSDGVRVLEVAPRGAAARAGIQVGDVLQSVGGQGTDSMPALQAQLYALDPGTAVVVGILRNGRRIAEHATLDKAPAA